MSGSNHTPQFWDRESSPLGQPIREDVRRAAHQVWPIVLREVRRSLGDHSEAAELLENAIIQISRYLQGMGEAASKASTPALLLTAVRRRLRRRVWKAIREQPSPIDLDLSIPDNSWEAGILNNILFDEISRHLSRRSAAILMLRLAGYEWSPIARLCEMSVAAAKNRFWRELGKLRLKQQGSD